MGVYEFFGSLGRVLGFIFTFFCSLAAFILLIGLLIAIIIYKDNIKKHRNIVYRFIVSIFSFAWFYIVFIATAALSLRPIYMQLGFDKGWTSVAGATAKVHASSDFYFRILRGGYNGDAQDLVTALVLPVLGLLLFSFIVIFISTFPKYNLFGNFIKFVLLASPLLLIYTTDKKYHFDPYDKAEQESIYKYWSNKYQNDKEHFEKCVDRADKIFYYDKNIFLRCMK